MAKKSSAAAVVQMQQPSMMAPGTGSERVNTRFIVLYGAPKARKTTTCSTLTNAKWIVSDSNSIPTLDSLNRLPPPSNIYEVDSIAEARKITQEAIDIAKEHGAKALGCSCFVYDSVTQFNDWHQQDVAQATNQRFMGDDAKNNGWQQFNAEFGMFIDDMATLSRYITVVVIAHAKEKESSGKGTWGGLNLPPQMALRLARTANWVFFQSIQQVAVDEGTVSDDFMTVAKDAQGNWKGTEVVIHTQPVGFWMTAGDPRRLDAEEPADMQKLLAKVGLWK